LNFPCPFQPGPITDWQLDIRIVSEEPLAYWEAEELFVQVTETSLRVLGQKHPSTLTSMGNLASTY